MCTMSMIGDQWGRDLHDRYPWVIQPPTTTPGTVVIQSGVSREEFEALRSEVAELKLLLQAAKRFDEKTGQPDCEVDAKVALIRKVAELVGVDMGDVFPKAP